MCGGYYCLAAAHGLHGLHALAAAQGLQAPQAAFLAAAHGLQAAQAALHAALHGLQDAYAGVSLTTGDNATLPAASPSTTGSTDAPERSFDLCIFMIVFSTRKFAEAAFRSPCPECNLNRALWRLRSN